LWYAEARWCAARRRGGACRVRAVWSATLILSSQPDGPKHGYALTKGVAQKQKIPFMLLAGDEDVAAGAFSYSRSNEVAS
jgi:hypothetical protein